MYGEFLERVGIASIRGADEPVSEFAAGADDGSYRCCHNAEEAGTNSREDGAAAIG
jgi:hypothetical protein